MSQAMPLVGAWRGAAFPRPVPFARNGSLKMLYDNRMYPQAVAHEGKVYIVWRGKDGFPFIRCYDLESRTFSEPRMLLAGLKVRVDTRRLKRDHHFAPVIWVAPTGYWHVLFGCHVRPGIHLVSDRPGDITAWKQSSVIADAISYPKVHRIAGDRTLIYFRHGPHLGSWTYRVSADGGRTWTGPERPVVDLNSEPQDGLMADHAGSYETTRVSADGRTLHVGFIWKVEKPVPNTRYHRVLGDHTRRYNLYYLKVDLASGRAFNYDGRKLATPVNKSTADRECLVWDTRERVAAVGPSICLDEDDQPYLLLPVSEETPYRCRFYFVRRRGGQWVKTPITGTSHPFNSCYLDRTNDGRFRAFLVTGPGEAVPEEGMDEYGWGDRVGEWISDASGENWKLRRDLTPIEGWKYQNIQFVSRDMRGAIPDMLLFYGWKDTHGPGTAFLWDNRK